MKTSLPTFGKAWTLWLLGLALAAEAFGAAPLPEGAGLPPLPPSPVQQFREWLALPPSERQKAVAEWPSGKQEVLLRKLRTYEALPAEERERRLKMIELRYYLRPLMGMKPEERASTLGLVPLSLKALVLERLSNWDSLDAHLREEILASDNSRELVTKYYLQLQQGRSKEEILGSFNPARRAEMDQALRTWNGLSASARVRTAGQLTAFFELPRVEQDRAFQLLSDSERQDIEKTLQAFSQLSPEQRRVCVESFQKFTMMPPPERASFLRNAARWQAMSPEERALWKKLVTKIPPLPPMPVQEPPRPEASQPRNRMAGTKGP